VVVCLGLLLMLTGCSKEEARPLPRVGVQQVQPTDFAARVTLTGDVQARVQTDLSFRVGGKIISRSVGVGDHVKANQVLARLDPKDLQNNVDSAKAEVFAAQARVTQTSAAFVRQQKLLPKGYTSQSEYDSAEAALRSARAHSRPPRRSWPMPTNNSATPRWCPRPMA
jgi:RND family efflux transporter MFP subunit